MAVLRAQNTAGGRKIQAIVRKSGYSLSRTFWRTGDARDWARRVEDAIASATPSRPFQREMWLQATQEAVDDGKPNLSWTGDKAFEHYGKTVTPRKKGAAQELSKIGSLRKSSLKNIRLDRLTQADVQAYADGLTAAGNSGSTVTKHVMLIRALFRDAVAEWKLTVANPCEGVRLPDIAPHRDRRFQDGEDGQEGEEARIRAVLAKKPSGSIVLDLLDLALDTGMRQAEILKITAGQVQRVDGVQAIAQPTSKNNKPRYVVLSDRAAAIVKRHVKGKRPEDRLFPWTGADLRQRWRAALNDAGVENLRWHDLRHEGLSRMAAKKMHIGMLMQQSGHLTVASVKRYLNATPKERKALLG